MFARRTLGIAQGRNPTRQQRVHGWIATDDLGPTIWNSYNVSGFTDDGTGLFTVTWRQQQSATQYAILGIGRYNASALAIVFSIARGGLPGLSTTQFSNADNNGALVDVSELTVFAVGAI